MADYTDFTENQRWLVRRSDTAGVEPTSGSSTQIDNTWADTDIMPGELFYNIIDKKLYAGNSGSTTLINDAAVSTAWGAGAGSNTLVSVTCPTGTYYSDDTVIVPSLTVLSGTAPTNPVAGCFYFDSTSSSFWGYDGSVWIEFVTTI